ncbi:uncharacterized protein MONBRDRAFT_30689, partial [Monosiga brevicollis MX1]
MDSPNRDYQAQALGDYLETTPDSIFRINAEDLTRSPVGRFIRRGIQHFFKLTIHLYFTSAPATQPAINPHTDNYHILILQLQGEKHWLVCQVDNAESCEEFTLYPGDVLFLPRRAGHVAWTTNVTSVHATIGFQGVDCGDLVEAAGFTEQDVGLDSTSPCMLLTMDQAKVLHHVVDTTADADLGGPAAIAQLFVEHQSTLRVRRAISKNGCSGLCTCEGPSWAYFGSYGPDCGSDCDGWWGGSCDVDGCHGPDT